MSLWIFDWVRTGSRELMSSSKVQEYYWAQRIDKLVHDRTLFKIHHQLFQTIQFHTIKNKVSWATHDQFNFYIFTFWFFANILIKPWVSLNIGIVNLFYIFWDQHNVRLILKPIKVMLFLLEKEKVEKKISSFQLFR